MKKIILLTTILIASCNNEPTQGDYHKLELQLKNCQADNKELKNTPENLLLKSQKLESEGELENAEKEYKKIVEKFPKTKQAILATEFISNREANRKKLKEEKERKKRIGYKALKEQTTVQDAPLTYSFKNIQLAKRWYFDRYGDRYHYRDSERGAKYITSNVTIKSEIKDPALNPIYAFKLENGVLRMIAQLTYEFYRWEDYGSYLGNSADYSNDFSRSSTITFAVGAQLDENEIKDSPIFILMRKSQCIQRTENTYSRPVIKYIHVGCDNEPIINLDEALSDFHTIKILNINKL